MIDIMIDLETMGVTTDSAIVSYGAVEFDPFTGELGHEIYRVIDLNSSMDHGMTVDGGTIYWWLQQTEGARLALIQDGNRESAPTAMKSLDTFIRGVGNPNRVRLWGNGPTFDNAMIRYSHIKITGQDLCIPFWNDRCVRTVKGFYPTEMWFKWRNNNPRRGTFHNALDDSKYQVKFMCNILNELGVKELY